MSGVDESDKGPKITAVNTGRRIDPGELGAKSVKRERRGPVVERINVKQRRPDENAPTGEGETAETVEGAPAAEAPTEERDARADRPPRSREPRRDRHERGKHRPPSAGHRSPGRADFSDVPPIVVKRDEDVGDFAAMLAQTGPIDRVDVRVGDRVRAKCVHMGSDTAFFELSRTQEAQAPLAEFLDKDGNVTLKVGDTIQAFVTSLSDGILLSTKLGKDQIDVGMLEQARIAGIPVQGTVSGHNKGGLEVALAGSARGFCPIGQIDVGFVDDPSTLVGKTFEFLVKEVRENGRNVVLSRRALVERERKEKGAQVLATLEVGKRVEGVVSRVQPFGVFVDLGGVDGMIPIGELSWGHVKHPDDVVKAGQAVTCEVTRIEDDPKRPAQPRIGLSLRAVQQDPFVAHGAELHPGAVVVGTVKKLESYGAFVELFPGVQGLVHVSEIADRRIAHPRDVLKVDEQVQVRILEVDPAARRVALSMKEGAVDLSGVAPDKRARGGVGRGTVVQGVVDRIERYGVFLKLDPVDGKELGNAFMPASESGTPKGSDLAKQLPLGTRVEAMVIDVDDRGRLKVSRTAREQAEERALVEEYKTDKRGGGSLGTLGDLLKAKMKK
jgi:small subunit ribosomal protein S1